MGMIRMDYQIMLADDVGINANEPNLTQCFLKRTRTPPQRALGFKLRWRVIKVDTNVRDEPTFFHPDH